MPPLLRCEFDRPYVEKLVAGDPGTERHFTQYFGQLLSLKLRSRLRTRALIEDAKQETFTRVLTTLKQKRGLSAPETLGAFVNSVCNNVLFELYRAGSRSEQLPESFDAPDRRGTAEETLLAGEQRERVRVALAALAPRDRSLLTSLFFEERDKDAICSELSVDRNHLRVLLHRAKLRFRESFGDGTE